MVLPVHAPSAPVPGSTWAQAKTGQSKRMMEKTFMEQFYLFHEGESRKLNLSVLLTTVF
jgi:hypothetical protein